MTDLDATIVDVDASELAELRQAFDACDANGDGWIVSKEFSGLLHALDQELSEDECLLAFEATDGDGDGSISFEEFMSWWSE
jgi:Ca2+-binding EF-hand superfamily protein